MAIQKGKTKKVEWTRKAIIHLASAAVLLLVSLILVYRAVRRWSLTRNATYAFRSYERNRIGEAIPAFRNALAWKGDYHEAREALAKIYVDAGKLDEAEKEYKELERADWPSPAVSLGLGVIALKRADKATDPNEIGTHGKAALTAFKKAACLEGAIGTAHAELLLALKGEDSTRMESARRMFEKIRSRLLDREEAAQVTREGLVDFYAGMGRIATEQTGYNPEAARHFRSCSHYAPGWPTPLVNVVYMEAKRFAYTTLSLDELNQMKTALDQFKISMYAQWSGNPTLYGNLRDPWMEYVLAVAYRFVEAGDASLFENWIASLRQMEPFKERPEPAILEALVWGLLAERAIRPDDKSIRMQHLFQRLDRFHDMVFWNDEAIARKYSTLRATTLNNMACGLEWFASYDQRPANDSFFDRAARTLEEALKLDPPSYEIHRNLAVLEKRRRGKEAARTYFDRAAQAAQNLPADSGLGKDFVELQNYMRQE